MSKIKAVFLFCVLALTCFACAAPVEDEGVGETALAATDACTIVPYSDGAYPIPNAPPGRRVEARLMNTGTATCSFEFSVDMWKNGVVTSGAKQGPFSLAPTASVTNPSPTKLLRQDFPGI